MDNLKFETEDGTFDALVEWGCKDIEHVAQVAVKKLIHTENEYYRLYNLYQESRSALEKIKELVK